MGVDEMKAIVRCFERWLDTPEAEEALGDEPNRRLNGIDRVREAAEQDVLSHTVSHAAVTDGPEYQEEEIPLVGFASLLTTNGVSAQEECEQPYQQVQQVPQQQVATVRPTLASGVAVGEFRATVNGQMKRVRMLDKAGGVLRVQVMRDDGGLSLTILTSIDQVHPEDRARVAHLFPAEVAK